MTFHDALRQLASHSTVAQAGLVERAIELREHLAHDPNDQVAFAELADLVRDLGATDTPADPLTADAQSSAEDNARLVLWSLAEELASDSRAWNPLIQLAKLTLGDDLESAVRYLTTAVTREDTGLALASAIKILRLAGYTDAAVQFGLGKWNANTHISQVGEEMIATALARGKVARARKYFELMEQAGLEDRIAMKLRVKIDEAAQN
ncbi:MAG: hypothetical protein GX483_07095 [Actinomycetaceae bacterium]|nr:hypothetical protein [Actinomycetaceae bacterium]